MNIIEKIIVDFFLFINKYFITVLDLIRHPSRIIQGLGNLKNTRHISPLPFLATSIIILNFVYMPFWLFYDDASDAAKDWGYRIHQVINQFLNLTIKDIVQNTLFVVGIVYLIIYILLLILKTPKAWRHIILGLGCYQYCLLPLIYSFISIIISPNILYEIASAAFSLKGI